MSHQEIPELDEKGLRQFGLILGGVLIVVCGFLLPWRWKWEALPNWYWIAGGGLIAAWALLHSRSVRVLYRAWMRVAMAIGAVVNGIVLAIVFFLIITPMGIVGRMRGKDPMRRSLDPEAASYRVKSKVAERADMERIY